MEQNRREFELIDRIRTDLGGQGDLEVGPGDDAAVIETDGQTVVSVDSMVEGVHFPADWPDPGDIVHRALAGALSDLAAMAARPRTALVALGLPAGRDPAFIEGLADATVEAAAGLGVSLAGGDVVGSPTLFVSVTVIGDLPGGTEPILRSGARSGDLVAVTGTLGGSAAGLSLATGADVPGLDRNDRARLLARYLRPTPRNAFGSGLSDPRPTAMIDVSDGLVADLGHLAAESGISISIDADLVPIAEGVETVALATARDPLGLALSSGEEYELAMTIDPGDVSAIRTAAERAGIVLTTIGEVEEGSGVEVSRDGLPLEVPPGFEHSF